MDSLLTLLTSRRRSLRALALAGGAVLVTVVSHVGCDDAYEAPCRVTARRTPATDPAISGSPAIALARSRGRAIASWPRSDVPDAGPDAMATGGPVGLTAFEVAVIDERGELGLRTSVPTPDALRSRRQSVEHAGVVVEDGTFLVHWVETTTTTDPDGRLRSAAALKAAYVTDGVSSALIAPVRGACEHCKTALAVASLGTESIALMRIAVDVVDASLGAPAAPAFVALRLRRDGSVIDEPVPWLTLPAVGRDGGIGGLSAGAAASAGDLEVDVDADGHLVIVSGGRAWLADAGLQLLSGPIVLPTAPDVRVTWDPSGEASVAWSVSPFEDGRSTSRAVPRDVFTGLVPAGASGIATRERVSPGRLVLAMDRRAEDVGVLFESADRTFFASVDPHGKKRGGDVLLSTQPSDYVTELGFVTSTDEHELFARGGGRFTVVVLGSGELVTTEIACAR